MIFNKNITPELKGIIKACTTVNDRFRIAEKHEFSIHTLNSLVEGNRNINDNNKGCVIDLVSAAIENAKKMDLTLLDYYQEIKNAKIQ